MDGALSLSPRRREIAVSGRGPGVISALDLGPRDRPIDIVFLHANGFNAQTYRSILAPVAAQRRILAVDQRGHGASTLATQLEGRTNWHEFRDDLIALMEALELTDVVLAGHSMGGTASVFAAAERPQQVRRLVLFDPVVLPPSLANRAPGEVKDSPLYAGALRRRAVFPSRQAAFEAYRGRGPFTPWTDAMVADYVAGGFVDLPGGDVGLACAPTWEASNFASHAHDIWGAFDRLTAPVDIYRAQSGSAFGGGEREADLLATGRYRIETVPGTSHFLPMERPDVVEAALRRASGA